MKSLKEIKMAKQQVGMLLPIEILKSVEGEKEEKW